MRSSPEPLPRVAHPADLTSGRTDDEGVGLHVRCDNSTGADERVLTDLMPTHDGGVGPDGHAVTDDGLAELVLSRHLGAVG